MKHYFSYLLIVCSLSSYTQNKVNLKGTVKGVNEEIIAIGDLLLINTLNETVQAYTTIIDGTYVFENILEGKYILKSSCMGYEVWQQEIMLNNNLIIDISLTQKINNLNEVEIVAVKNPITYINGNYKLNIENPVFLGITNVLDVVSKLPNVQLAPDRESITIIGKGAPLIYMGNQQISFEDFISMPTTSISTIEIINNPSSKYEASGRTVLLVTRKLETEGTSLNANETISFKRNFNNYFRVNGNYTKHKWTFRGNLTYNVLQQWESNSFDFNIPEATIKADYLVLIPNNDRKELNTEVGLHYQKNAYDYFSLNIIRKLQTNDSPIETKTFLLQESVTSNILSNTENDNTKNYFSSNLNFNKKITKDLNLFSGIQYSSFKQELTSEISNNNDNTGFVLDQIRIQKYRINSMAFKMDIDKEISKKEKLKFGFNWNKAWADANTIIEQLLKKEIENSNYNYQEDIYSVYTSFENNLNKYIDINMGIRVENNQVKSVQETSLSPLIERTKTNIFPKVGLNIKFDSIKTLTFNYGKSVTRPDFSRSSSIKTFINPILEASGNINLLPTFTNELSLNYQWKNKSFDVTYYKNINPLFFTISYDQQNEIALLSQVNLDSESGFNLGITLPYTYNIWTSNNTFRLSYTKINRSEATYLTSKPYLYVYSNQQFLLKKNTSLAFDGWLLTNRQEGVFKRNSMLVLNASITTIVFEKLQCTIQLNDITKAMNFEEYYIIDGVEANGVYYVDAQEVSFSMKYTFGNKKKETFKNINVDQNSDRID